MCERFDGGRGICGPAGAAAWCERFLSTNRSDRLLLRSARSTLGGIWWRLAEWASIPGLISHWMCRKRAIDQLVNEAAGDGFKQLIVLGGGLDSLAFRLADERVYDRILSADYPATLAVVRKATGSADSRVSSKPAVSVVELISIDLERDDIYTTISASPEFDVRLPTVIVIEGVLMYLSAPTVERVLRSVARLSSARLRLVASSMIVDHPGDPPGFTGQSRWIRRWLSSRHEPMLWASTREGLLAKLVDIGWNNSRLLDLSQEDGGRRRHDAGLRSETLVTAERQGSDRQV